MKKLSKPVVVLAGYAIALLLTCAIFYLYVLLRKHIDPGSGGMQAFGDSLLFLGLFGFLALIPTGLMVYFLRPFEKLWTILSGAALALSVLGVIAAVMVAKPPPSPWASSVLGLLGILKIMGAPVFGLAFLIFAAIAPTPRSRWLLAVAAAIEFAVSAYVFFSLFVIGHWLQ